MSEQVDALQEDDLIRVEPDASYDDETILWEGGPSQWVNLGSFIFWGIIFITLGIFSLLWNSGLSNDYQPLIDTLVSYTYKGLFVLGLFSVLLSYLTVRYEYTTVTKNKIKEAKGITRIFRTEKYCEISDISDITSPPAGLLGLVGLSTLVIETKDDDQPIIKIRAIRDRESLIAKLLPVWRKLKVDRKGSFGG
jgi:hypothetical protein